MLEFVHWVAADGDVIMFTARRVQTFVLTAILALAGGAVFGDEDAAAPEPVLHKDKATTALMDEGFTARQMAGLEAKVSESRGRLTRVRQKLAQAKNSTDTLKVTCLDDKANQLKANLAGIEERFAAAKSAFREGDRALAALHAGAMDVSFATAAQLEADADACIGDADVVLGETETSSSTNQEGTDEKEKSASEEMRVDSNQPSQASPTF